MSEPLVKIVSCGCTPDTPEPRLAFVLEPAGTIRIPGQLDADLLGYYPLGDAGGDDISGRDNHATPAIEPFGLTRGILCEQAELLDGRQAFSLPFELLGAITVSLFIRPALSRTEMTVLSVGPDIRFGLTFMLEPIIAINRDRPNETNVTAPRLAADNWYHLAFTLDTSGEVAIYVDGVRAEMLKDGVVTAFPNVPNPASRGPAFISRYVDGSGLHGAAQDVAIRSGVLTADEIRIERDSYCTQLLEIGE